MFTIMFELIAVGVVAFLASRLVPDRMRGTVSNALKLYLTVRMVWLLLLWPIKTADGAVVPAWQQVLDVLAQIDAATFWTWALIGAAIRFVGIMGSMLRWLLVLRGQGIDFPFRHIFGAFLIGRAIGFFLPSTAGLDAYKLYDASRFSGKTVEVTAGTVLEKVLGVTGIFLTFLISLPFGISIFGENATAVALVTVPMAAGIIGGLMALLFFPGLVQWAIERIPLPGKARLEGVVLRISGAAAAYRGQYGVVLGMLFFSWGVHFTTAAMYYCMALAVGAGATAAFWPIVFGSSIQIFATVIGPTIGGLGVREAAQLLTIGALIGVGPAIVSATLGFWVGEVPTLFGFFFWLVRGKEYTPGYCRVNGRQVDYEEAAKAAVTLETAEQEAARVEVHGHSELPSVGQRILESAGIGLGAGVLAGILIGGIEALVIGAGVEGQVFWYGPLSHAVFFGALGTLGGIALGVLPMERKEIQAWVPTLGLIAMIVPFGLAFTVFRLRRDVYLEQMPPLPVLLGVLAGFAVIALLLFFPGRAFFASAAGRIARPGPALGLLAAVCGLGFVAAALSSTAEEPAAAPPVPAALAERPNVILIMVDTLRADHLSCYDEDAPATPHMCSLLEGGAAYEAFAHASWTKPATASLLTSLLPSSHNAMSKPSSLSDDVVMVSEAMKEAGYATGGIVSNINLAESFGFDQGYDEYHYLAPDYIAGAAESSSKLVLYSIVRKVWFSLNSGLRFGDFYQDSQVVNAVAFDWLDRHRDSRFFLFLHYMDPHDPYFEHPYDGRAVARVSTPEPDPEHAAELRRLYRGEIEYLDRNIGELFERLRAQGLWDDTVIALVADHGEEFHEHGGWWHGLTLYDEQIHVPFLIKWADDDRVHPRATEEIVRIIDVVPTLLARAGLDVPDAMQGIDVAGSPFERMAKDRQVFSEEDHEGNVLWSLRTRDMKLIEANPGNPRGLPEREFFLIEGDPGETSDLSGPAYEPEMGELGRYADLQRRAAEGEAVAAGGSVEMTRAECEQLKNLGYVEDCSHIPN